MATKRRGLKMKARAASAGASTGLLPKRTPEPLVLVACVSALVAVAATFIATARGPGLDPDSATYFSSGINLAHGNGLRTFAGVPLTVFPPGLPAVVALGHWLGITAEWSVRLLNAGSFFGAVLLGFLLLRRHVQSNWLIAGATALLGVSLPLLDVFRMAWSEPPFIVVCLGFILILERLVTRRRTLPWLAAAAALVWVAFVFRYAGLALIPAGALALLLARQLDGWRSRMTSTIAFVALSAIVPIVWIVRNHFVDGTYLGDRTPSADGPTFVARRVASVLGEWVIPGGVGPSLDVVAGATMAVVIIGGVAWYLMARTRRVAVRTFSSGTSLTPILAFTGSYVAYLALAQLATALDPIDLRLMSPVYIPLIVLGTVALERVFSLVPATTRTRVVVIGGSLLAIFLVGQALAFAYVDGRSSLEPPCDLGQSCKSSELADAVTREVPVGANLYSNNGYLLWTVLRREPILEAPAKASYRSNVTLAIPDRFITDVTCRVSYLAWFHRGSSNFFTPAELGNRVMLRVVATGSDGRLYRITPLSPVPVGGPRC
jgi:hypothetical protein